MTCVKCVCVCERVCVCVCESVCVRERECVCVCESVCVCVCERERVWLCERVCGRSVQWWCGGWCAVFLTRGLAPVPFPAPPPPPRAFTGPFPSATLTL